MDNFADKIHVHFWKLKFLQWSMKEITTPLISLYFNSMSCQMEFFSCKQQMYKSNQHTYSSDKMSNYKMIFSILLVSIIMLRINSMKLKSFEFKEDDLNISLTFLEENEQSTELVYDVNVTRWVKIWKIAMYILRFFNFFEIF